MEKKEKMEKIIERTKKRKTRRKKDKERNKERKKKKLLRLWGQGPGTGCREAFWNGRFCLDGCSFVCSFIVFVVVARWNLSCFFVGPSLASRRGYMPTRTKSWRGYRAC